MFMRKAQLKCQNQCAHSVNIRNSHSVITNLSAGIDCSRHYGKSFLHARKHACVERLEMHLKSFRLQSHGWDCFSEKSHHFGNVVWRPWRVLFHCPKAVQDRQSSHCAILRILKTGKMCKILRGIDWVDGLSRAQRRGIGNQRT